MAYCTKTQVAGEFNGLTLNSTSVPTDTTVDRFIEEADAEIDGRLGLKYSAPITGATSLIIVRTISIGLVAERIKEVLKISGLDSKIKEEAVEKNLAKEARKRLDEIIKGCLLLPDATLLSSGNGVNSFNVDNGEEHTWEKGVDQW
jgi:hypothetical protein